MAMFKWLAVSATAGILIACGGGGGDSGQSSFGAGTGTGAGATGSTAAKPVIGLSLSTTTVTTATPATVTAVVKDTTGAGVAGQVVTFATVGGLGSLSATTALTDGSGTASTTLNATSATQSGADQVSASVSFNGATASATTGFQLTAPTVAIASVTADTTALGAYGQTGVQVKLSGTVAGTPSTVALTSGCIASGKAILTPATATTTTGNALFTYKDSGCGAANPIDTLRASVTGTAASGSLALNVASPAANSITFVSASPASIYLKGSGFGETSTVTFKVLDAAGNGLPRQSVTLKATTLAGGLTLNGAGSDVVVVSDSNGNVSSIVNSGTVPTPVRVTASLTAQPVVTTVSSTLAIAVGLPSQLNFSLAQGTFNIEGYNVDGTLNTYSIIASDRLGNPVPAGTAINFITEGGQIEAVKTTAISANGIATVTANFVSASPRPRDGRVTVLAYALGEESFLDQNGNNIWDAGEPFQDLGSIYLDRYFNNHYNAATDQFISLMLPGATTTSCSTTSNPLLPSGVSIPSIPSVDPSYPGFVAPSSPTSCDGTWGRSYVRRAVETVFSTSDARPLWTAAPAYASVTSNSPLTVSINADESKNVVTFPNVLGTKLYCAGGTYTFLVADANPERLNPMAAGTTVGVSATSGLTALLLGGSPVASTPEATFASFLLSFVAPTTSGTVTLLFTSPRGLVTSVGVPVFATPAAGGPACGS